MKKLVIAMADQNPSEWLYIECEDILAQLKSMYPTWPDNAHFYYGEVSDATDITPKTADDLELIQSQDSIIVVMYPGVVAAIVAVVAVVVGVAVAYFMMPSVASNTQKNTVNQSPNNDLTSRTNKPRPNARIPDPFGEVRSTPDLLGQPYTKFINHQEVEIDYLCFGRGSYQINESDVYDETTLFREIAGASLQVYAPFTSPNSGDVPQLQIGDPINLPVETVFKLNTVNGQTLRSPNDNKLVGDSNIVFHYPNGIEIVSNSETTSKQDFTDLFSANDKLTITKSDIVTGYEGTNRLITAHPQGSISFPIDSNVVPNEFLTGGSIKLTGALFQVKNSSGYVTKTYDLSGTYRSSEIRVVTAQEEGVTKNYLYITFTNPSAINPKWSEADGVTTTTANVSAEVNSTKISLDGEYTVLTVASSYITLSNPSAVNSNWRRISITEANSPTLSTSGDKWVGPFVVSNKETTTISANFVASNGLYKDNGERQERIDVTIEMEYTLVDSAGVAIAKSQTSQVTMEGSDTNRTTRAVTLRVDNLDRGIYRVRVRRVTPTDLNYKGSVVDEVKWRDLFNITQVSLKHFGNVTTAQVLNYATTGALTLKERKVNAIITRMVSSVGSDYKLLPNKIASRKISDILLEVALDPFIGRRQLREMDLESIYKTEKEVIDYFGSDKAFEFAYTFDKTNTSFEETCVTIAQAGFSEVFRQGNVIQLFFERESDNTVLLFNHRNVLPDTAKMNFRFGNLDDYNGVIYSYTNPDETDTLDKITLSIDGEVPNNPKEVEGVGVRNRLQAYFLACRIWNKIQHQNITLNFDATQEGEILLKGSKILVSDLITRSVSQGYIRKQELLVLTLSQKVDLDPSVKYGVSLQLGDATVVNIPIEMTTNNKQIKLTKAPPIPLNLDPDNYSDSRYIIYKMEDLDIESYLVSERKSNSNLTTTITAYNYDSLYYTNDKQYIKGEVNENGYPITVGI